MTEEELQHLKRHMELMDCKACAIKYKKELEQLGIKIPKTKDD